MSSYIIVINKGILRQSIGCEWFIGKYIEGPRTPSQVKRYGYGFTDNKEKAWPFPSEARACAKALIVSKHMSWGAPRFMDLEEINK